MAFHVEKKDYSHGAWRVLDETGAQVWKREKFDHPNLGEIVTDGPVCFERKRDAVAWIAANTPGHPMRGGGDDARTS